MQSIEYFRAIAFGYSTELELLNAKNGVWGNPIYVRFLYVGHSQIKAYKTI